MDTDQDREFWAGDVDEVSILKTEAPAVSGVTEDFI